MRLWWAQQLRRLDIACSQFSNIATFMTELISNVLFASI